MTLFSQFLNKLEQVKLLKSCIKEKSPAMAVGLSLVHQSNLLLSLCTNSENNGFDPMIVITKDEQSAYRMCDDFNCMAGKNVAEVFPYRDLIIRPIESFSNEYETKRLGVLSRVVSCNTKVVFCSITAACSYTIPKRMLENSIINLSVTQNIPQNILIQKLLLAGYARRDQVDGIGQFAVRGAIVDMFSTSLKEPIRLEYWGDEIDNISNFDIDTQRRVKNLKCADIYPASELMIDNSLLVEKMKKLLDSNINPNVKMSLERDIKLIEQGISISNVDKYISLIFENKSTVFDYFSDSVVIISELSDVKKAGQNYDDQWQDDLKILDEEGDMFFELHDCRPSFDCFFRRICKSAICLENFRRDISDLKIKHVVSFDAIELGSWTGERKALFEEIKTYHDKKYTIVIMAGTEKAAHALFNDLTAYGISSFLADNINHKLSKSGVYITKGAISSGFSYKAAKFAVISIAKTKYHEAKKAKKRVGEQIKSLSDLNIGDFVVHVSHGIGNFAGIEKITVQDVEKDYIKIKYAGSDILYVPVTQLDLVSKYIGSGETRVKLNKLGTDDWHKTRGRVKKVVAKMAKELIKLYAKRKNTEGFAFSKDNDWMANFEQHFEYEETDDQLEAISEIKKDMEAKMPMDRLLCGDVGFGKTEVALRAAFKCVLDGKQCAFLCPTTILAWQHYKTAIARFGDFPVTIELLSRFKTQKQQKDIIKRLANGSIDMLIGTHRIVQNDVIFKNLGLAIVDEEQRFGVVQKERFKQIFNGVDVLSLSATPIPRTLNMAMSGIRDMSVLEQPPKNRQPIQTYVMEYNASVIYEAIQKELRRGGQVYYIHNKINSINLCAERIKNMLPDARVKVAHSKMNEKELSSVWEQLLNHEIDILVCTTIIETGVDISNVNTMIVENADRLGLSQLYQLRGRIGRSQRRAFAYFTFVGGKALSEVATKRLTAIREFTRFGSGFKVALRDLEIRGAGNLLGESQHGQMEAVGYDMYIRILNEAIDEIQGKQPKNDIQDCIIDLPLSAHIPENYISNLSQRLEIYRKIAALRSEDDKLDLVDELIDRFGEPPQPVSSLMEVAILRARSAEFGFNEIIFQDVNIKFYPLKLNMQKMVDIIHKLGNRAVLNAGDRPYLAVKILNDKPLDVIRLVLSA